MKSSPQEAAITLRDCSDSLKCSWHSYIHRDCQAAECAPVCTSFSRFSFLIVSESGPLASDFCFLGCCVNVLLLFLISVLVIKSCLIKSGRMRGSLVTLQKLVQLFPGETSFKNDLGVGYLLIGDNSNAKKVYEEVSFHSSQGKLLLTFLCSFWRLIDCLI